MIVTSSVREPRVLGSFSAWQLLIRIILAVGIPVVAVEAQYWEWSRFPSAGYIDQPPLVAWMCRLFCSISPEPTRLTLRAGSLLVGTGVLFLVHRIALQITGCRETARRASWLAAALPVLLLSGVVLSTDVLLVFFSLLTLSLFLSALRTGALVWWCFSGVAMGLALLSDIRALLSALAFLLFLAAERRHQKWFGRAGPYVFAAFSVAVFSPFLMWNLARGWPTVIAHTTALYRFEPGLGRIGEFLFEQMANASPFLVIPLAMALFVPSRRVPHRSEFLLLKCHAACVLVFFLVVGAVYAGHPNWTIGAYPPAVVALAIVARADPRAWFTRHLDTLARISLLTMIVLALTALLILSRLSDFDMSILPGSLGKGLARVREKLYGWSDLHREVDRLRARETLENPVLFTWDEEEAHMLSYLHRGDPFVALKGFVRPLPKPGDAQIYYLSTEAWRERGGILVTSSRSLTKEMLMRCFDGVSELPSIELEYGRQVVLRYRVFRMKRFRELRKLPR